MKVIYDSLSGQGKRFAESLGFETQPIHTVTEDDLQEPCLFITRCVFFGNMPDSTADFLDDFQDLKHNIIGTAITGSKNWGSGFGRSGDIISDKYGIPCIHKFEGSGFKKDRAYVKEYLENYVIGTEKVT